MVGTIFNLPKVNTVLCMCTVAFSLSLPRAASRRLATYIEKENDVYSQEKRAVLILERVLKTINSVNSANYQILSASAGLSIVF